MYNWTLFLHSIFRWFILIFLAIAIINAIVNTGTPYDKKDRAWYLRLLIVSHTTLLIGLYQYFFGPKGWVYLQDNDMGTIMKNSVMRFWFIEHITGMLLAIVLITIGNKISKSKTIDSSVKHKKLLPYLIAALVIIVAVIPWPFRFSDVPWLRGMS